MLTRKDIVPILIPYSRQAASASMRAEAHKIRGYC